MSIKVLEILTKEQAEIIGCGYLRTSIHVDVNPKDVSSILTKYIGFGSIITTIHDENKPHRAKHLLFLKMYQNNDNLLSQVSIKILPSDCKFARSDFDSGSPNPVPIPNQERNQLMQDSMPFFVALDDGSPAVGYPASAKMINKVDIRCGIIEISKKNKHLNDNLYNILSFAIKNKEQFIINNNNKNSTDIMNDNLKNVCDRIIDCEKQYQLRDHDKNKNEKKRNGDHDDDIGVKYVSFGSDKSNKLEAGHWRQFGQVGTHYGQLRDKFYSVFRGKYHSIEIGNDDKINMVIKYDKTSMVNDIDIKGYYLDVMINNLSIYDNFLMDRKNYNYYHVLEVNNCCCKGKKGLKYQIELIQNKDDTNHVEDVHDNKKDDAPLPGQA